jgi:hypothetical protein
MYNVARKRAREKEEDGTSLELGSVALGLPILSLD